LNPGAYNKPEICALTGVHGEKIHLDVDTDPFRINNIRPYLRSMSSMTEEEENEYIDFLAMWDAVDWLNEHHFDYHGLISKNLALEAPADMYKTE